MAKRVLFLLAVLFVSVASVQCSVFNFVPLQYRNYCLSTDVHELLCHASYVTFGTL